MFTCPQCGERLVRARHGKAYFWACSSCNGRAVNVSVLRRTVHRGAANQLWHLAREGQRTSSRLCPCCSKSMTEVVVSTQTPDVTLDVCCACQFVWFDATEYEQLPPLPAPASEYEGLSAKSREQLAMFKLEQLAKEAQGSDWGTDPPEEWWQVLASILGMPVEYDVEPLTRLPWMTWGLIVLISLVSVLAFFDLERVVNRYGLIPAEIERYGGLTLITSFFLHAGIFHLVSNMYFLLIFGDNVEEYLGRWRFVLLLLAATVAGDLLHAAAYPQSDIPCIGASGGISGVLACYCLAFPRAGLGILFRRFAHFRWIRMPAYAALILWTLLQLLGTYMQIHNISSVSALAHLGGAAMGVVFWLMFRRRGGG